MPNPDLSILVVDDAKFSSTMIGRTLATAGYRDIRYATSAADALTQLEQRPANVVLADWLMPEVDGLQLTARIRQQDELHENYSYVILLTGREGEQALAHAFDQGVDDFISKSVMNEQLVPRVYAADRLCGTLQRLMQEKRRLTATLTDLEQRMQFDPLTGLGNLRHLEQKLSDSLRHVETRDGALCYLLIGIQGATELRESHGEAGFQELQRSIARRLQQTVRPMDLLFRLDDSHYVLLVMLNEVSDATPTSFRRLHDSLNLKAFQTSEGFVNLKAGVAMVCLDNSALPKTPQDVMQAAAKLLPAAYNAGRVAPIRLTAANAE